MNILYRILWYFQLYLTLMSFSSFLCNVMMKQRVLVAVLNIIINGYSKLTVFDHVEYCPLRHFKGTLWCEAGWSYLLNIYPDVDVLLK